VAYNGFEEMHFADPGRQRPRRDPFRLIYFSHPSKGLHTAIDIVHRLRAHDERYHMAVFGGARLWGESDGPAEDAEGVLNGGLIGQRSLASELARSTFSIQLQDRPEPGALAIVDALRAGCVILASPVGCYPEMILNGANGLLVNGNCLDDEPRRQAAGTILALQSDRERLKALSRGARSAPWSSDVMAGAWSRYFDWRLGEEAGRPESGCARCGATALDLGDGRHCTRCGHYARIETVDSGDDRHG